MTAAVDARDRAGQVGRRVAHLAGRVAYRGWRAGSWVFRSAWRMLTAAWLVGLFTVGTVSMAAADDGLIVGPDLGSAGGQTVFEQLGPERFSLYLQLSDSQHGAPYITESMWEFLRAIETALFFMAAALARGAITAMQWMLNLNLYADNAATLDAAVRSVAALVFWPLFAATMAIGAFSAYARMKKEGGGSLFNDAAWLVAASILAGAFAIQPSSVMGELDGARTALAGAAMKGYTAYGSAGESAAGFAPVSLPNDQAGATRKLADSMWNVYVVTPWCYINYNSLTTCRDVGHEYLAGSARWEGLTAWMEGNNGGNSDDENGAAYCPPELNTNCDWVRGQSFGRLGATIFVVVVTVPLVLMLLALVLFGIISIVGVLLLVLIGLFFLLGWMIPGRPRQMGVRWFEELLGSMIQSVIITAILGSVMVLGAILNASIGRYGFFMVGLLNVAVFVVGFRMRGRLENIAGMGGGTSSPMSGYMAMRALGGIGKTMNRAARGAIGGAVTATPILAGATAGTVRLGGQIAAAGARGIGNAAHALKTLPNNLTTTTGGRGGGGVATPYRPPRGPGGAGPGRAALTLRGDSERAALPAAASTQRGQTRALEAAGTSRQTVADGSRPFVAPDPTPTPRRTFAPTTHRGQPGRRAEETPGISGAGPHRPITNLVKPAPEARPWRPSPRAAIPTTRELPAPPSHPAPSGRAPQGRGGGVKAVVYPTSRSGGRTLPHRITPTRTGPPTGQGGTR